MRPSTPRERHCLPALVTTPRSGVRASPPRVQKPVPENVTLDAERVLRRVAKEVFDALVAFILHTPTPDSQRALEHLEETLARARSSLESDRGARLSPTEALATPNEQRSSSIEFNTARNKPRHPRAE